MTLTTERQQFAEQNEMSMEFVNWFFDEKKDGCGNAWFIMAAAMWEGWKGQAANREAQPVAYIADCGTIVSESDPFFDEYKNPQPLYTAPPAPAYPERLPCPVRLMPGLLFGKGVPTESMLDALKRREEYEAELEAMTPEQRAENDARLDRLKALIPQQTAPAIPGILTVSMAAEKAFRFGAILNSTEAEQFAEGWNACRAAMLAQPVSQSYKLPVELHNYDGGCVVFGAADDANEAPEGGK